MALCFALERATTVPARTRFRSLDVSFGGDFRLLGERLAWARSVTVTLNPMKDCINIMSLTCIT